MFQKEEVPLPPGPKIKTKTVKVSSSRPKEASPPPEEVPLPPPPKIKTKIFKMSSCRPNEPSPPRQLKRHAALYAPAGVKRPALIEPTSLAPSTSSFKEAMPLDTHHPTQQDTEAPGTSRRDSTSSGDISEHEALMMTLGKDLKHIYDDDVPAEPSSPLADDPDHALLADDPEDAHSEEPQYHVDDDGDDGDAGSSEDELTETQGSVGASQARRN